MTAAARHAIRAIAHWNPDPADVLAKANEVILAGDYEDRFVTVKLAYLRRDGDHGRGKGGGREVASSGHPGPAVIRPDGQVELMSGGGLPLGLFPDAEPERETVELGPGDQLFFFSDGVTEARSPDQRYFEDYLAGEPGGRGRAARAPDRPDGAGPRFPFLPGQPARRHDDPGRQGAAGRPDYPWEGLPARLGTFGAPRLRPGRPGLRLLAAVGGHDLGGDLGDLDVAAL